MEYNRFHIHWYDGPTLPANLGVATEEATEDENDDSDVYSLKGCSREGRLLDH